MFQSSKLPSILSINQVKQTGSCECQADVSGPDLYDDTYGCPWNAPHTPGFELQS
jgi:hypothetical protein